MTDRPIEVPPDLHPLSTTPPLAEYVRSIWHRREFAWSMSVGDMRARHLDTVLGGFWHVLNPLLQVGVYWLIFGVILGVDRGVDNFIGFLAVGIFIFQFSQRSIVGSAASINDHVGLIRSLQFPRALLPLSAVMREAIALRSAAIVMVTIVLITGEGISWTWVLVPGVVALQFVFNLGGGLAIARFADRIRDIENVLPFVFRLLFYMSGVLFLVDRFVSDPTLQSLFILNPFYAYINLTRDFMLSTISHPHLPWLWVSVLAWSAVAILAGMLIFRSGEASYGRG